MRSQFHIRSFPKGGFIILALVLTPVALAIFSPSAYSEDASRTEATNQAEVASAGEAMSGAETQSALLVSDGEARLSEELGAAIRRSLTDISYTLEITEKTDTGEIVTKMKIYAKDPEHFRIDVSIDGESVRVVALPDGTWAFAETQNVLIPSGDFGISSETFKKEIGRTEKMIVTRELSGKNIKYDSLEKATGKKTVYLVDARSGLIARETEYDERGNLISDTLYEEIECGKIGDALLAKPEGAEEIEPSSEQDLPTEGGMSK
jgi:outer membrane lipoprotein-sorting protein